VSGIDGGGSAYSAWTAVRRVAMQLDHGLELMRQGKGRYLVRFQFTEPGKVFVAVFDAVGPSADIDALRRAVDAANATEGPRFELADPLVICREELTYGPEGITIEEFEGSRARMISRMDAHHDAFAAPGDLPFSLVSDERGFARIVPWSRVRAEKAIEAAEAAAPSPEKPKDTKGE
jgi:hypothetical protein